MEEGKWDAEALNVDSDSFPFLRERFWNDSPTPTEPSHEQTEPIWIPYDNETLPIPLIANSVNDVVAGLSHETPKPDEMSDETSLPTDIYRATDFVVHEDNGGLLTDVDAHTEESVIAMTGFLVNLPF
jgi:hypothetical protein